jgi:hypothetical protein
MLILLGNYIPENPGPFDNEISIFHLNIRSIRHKLDYVEALALGSSIVLKIKNIYYITQGIIIFYQ